MYKCFFIRQHFYNKNRPLALIIDEGDDDLLCRRILFSGLSHELLAVFVLTVCKSVQLQPKCQSKTAEWES